MRTKVVATCVLLALGGSQSHTAPRRAAQADVIRAARSATGIATKQANEPWS
jgi:hypothetical protein